MHNLSRRSFLGFAGRGATIAAASAAMPLAAASASTATVGNQSLKKIVQRPDPLPDPEAEIRLPIDPLASPEGEYVVIYSATMLNLQAGDTLQVLAEIQAVNHSGELLGPTPNGHPTLGTNVQLGTWVNLATSAGRTVPVFTGGETYICRPSGANIMSLPDNIGNHYGVPTRVGAVTIPTTRTWFVNVVAYGLCDDPRFSPTTRLLTVRPYYGGLTVMLFR